jgi:DNA-binding PadR family transcriptional regulator
VDTFRTSAAPGAPAQSAARAKPPKLPADTLLSSSKCDFSHNACRIDVRAPRRAPRRHYLRDVYTQCIFGPVSVPLTLLGLLEREPSHGYDLKRDYDAYFGRGKQLPFGQVYATLGRLARDGKVIAGDAEPGDGPDRKRYAITETGRDEVDAWLVEPVEPEPHLQTVLFAKVTLALMLGKPAGAYLNAQRAAHIRRMQELTEIRRNGPLVDVLLADHALFHLEADLRWIDLTSARLAELAEAVAKR